jgi:(p)ppGpp synthase/HD superfamily hydrolase
MDMDSQLKDTIRNQEKELEISGREELNRIIDKIRGIDSVIDIERTTG